MAALLERHAPRVSLRIASYNVLADSYIRRSFYPGTPPSRLDPSRRHPALAAHVAALGADVVCLQEVEPPVLEAIGASLPGYEVHHEPKRGKPDSVATLTRLPAKGRGSVVYADGTGHVALFVVVEHEGRRLGIANTHVKWDPTGHVYNKIGTYQVALMAKQHNIPFYVAAPLSTFDLKSNPKDVIIEQRKASEVTGIGDRKTAPDDINVINPAFDMTPPELITGIITEAGVATRPFEESIQKLFKSKL